MTASAQMYMAHHGIAGQKWGKRNGPPYPLEYSKLSPEERSEAKQKAIRTGNIKEAQQNKDYYNDNELDAVIKRFRLNASLDSLNAAQVKTGMQKLNQYGKSMGTVAEAIGNTYKTYSEARKLLVALGLVSSNSNSDKPANKSGNQNSDKPAMSAEEKARKKAQGSSTKVNLGKMKD